MVPRAEHGGVSAGPKKGARKTGEGRETTEITKRGGAQGAQAHSPLWKALPGRSAPSPPSLLARGHGARRRWRQGLPERQARRRLLELLHGAGAEHGQEGAQLHGRRHQDGPRADQPAARCLLAAVGHRSGQDRGHFCARIDLLPPGPGIIRRPIGSSKP